jgi:hypothetical protein
MLTLVVGTSRAVEGWRTAPAQEDAEAAQCAACTLGDVATPLVEAHAHLEPVVTHWYFAHPA